MEVRYRRLHLFVWLLSLSFGVGASLSAQTSISRMTFPPQDVPVMETTDLTEGWRGSLSIAESDIDLGAVQQQSTIGAVREYSKGRILYFGAGYDRRGDSTLNSSKLGVSPFYKVDTLELNSRYVFSNQGDWGGYAMGSLDLAVADHANISDGYSMIASAGASYAVNPKLRFSFGLLSTRSPVTHFSAMPIIGIDWDITDRLKLRTLNGAFLTYDLGDSIQFDLSVQYRDQSFAIDVENLQGTVFMKMDDKAIIEESSIIGTLGVKHNWKDVFSIRAFAEIVGNRDFEIVLDDEKIQKPVEKDKAISFGVEGGIRF